VKNKGKRFGKPSFRRFTKLFKEKQEGGGGMDFLNSHNKHTHTSFGSKKDGPAGGNRKIREG